MNLSRLIRPLFPTVIVGIEIDYKTCYIVAHFYKNNRLISTQTKEFRTNPGELPMQAVRYIKKIRNKNPFTYISVLAHSIIQGVLSTDKEEEFKPIEKRWEETGKNILSSTKVNITFLSAFLQLIEQISSTYGV